MINKRNKIDDIRLDPEMDFDMEAYQVATVKNAIPNIHENEPLASLFENPPNEIN